MRRRGARKELVGVVSSCGDCGGSGVMRTAIGGHRLMVGMRVCAAALGFASAQMAGVTFSG